MPDAAVTIIGGGVVGLAIAAELAPKRSPLFLLERYPKYGQETSSRNSEVIHAGIYYPNGSLKAALCVEGRERLYALCAAHDIPHRRITKIITAPTSQDAGELDRLETLARGNGVELERLTAAAGAGDGTQHHHVRRALLPGHGDHQRPRVDGLLPPRGHGARGLRPAAMHRGGAGEAGGRVDGGRSTKRGQRSSFTSEWVVNAAGLESDTIASYAGIDVDAAGYRVHYCKGSYFSLPASMNGCISRLVYPTPTKHSLGVHALMDLGGRLKFGPDVEYLPDRRLDYTVAESKKRAFAESVRRILPFVKDEELTPDMSGIRPKVQAQGEAAKDFVIRHERDRGLEGFIDLIGIESPGLTASPAIARTVRELMEA